MQVLLFGATVPVIPLLWWRARNKEKMSDAGYEKKLVLRYIVYTLVIAFLSSAAMLLVCEEGASLLEKMDVSGRFALKYAVLEVALAFVVGAAEWLYTSREVAVCVDWEQYRNAGLIRFIRKWIVPAGIYLLAAFVIILNISLMFDNVLWGDEAFSANTAKKSMAGIMQVLYYWDNHPPLHYYWLKLFGELFGHTVPVYHLASLVPFMLGQLLAVTAFRKRFGNIPAAFFVVISGLGYFCLEYNLEVRMYSLAFLGVMASFYCAYRVFCGGKAAWFYMVFWALVAAYAHYYGLVTVGIMLFITGVAYWARHRGKAWIKGLLALVGFIVGYMPWLTYLLTAVDNVSHNWWMTDVMSLKQSLFMVMGGARMNKLVFALTAGLLLIMLLAESSILEIVKKEQKIQIKIHTPSIKNWSDNTYAAAVGALTIFGTLLFAYLLCVVMGPMLTERYLYPLSAVTFVMLVIECGHMLTLLKQLDKKYKKTWMQSAGKAVMLLVLVVFVAAGLSNYKLYRAQVKDEDRKTQETLDIVGEPEADVQFVSNGVKHLGWTVLYHYFPENEIVNGDFRDTQADKFWYFTPNFMTEEEMQEMRDRGYLLYGYGEKQLSQYPFVLYYFEKIVPEMSAQAE